MCRLCDELEKDIDLNGFEISIWKDDYNYKLCIEHDFDYSCGGTTYSNIDINYCLLCGKELIL